MSGEGHQRFNKGSFDSICQGFRIESLGFKTVLIKVFNSKLEIIKRKGIRI